jgi:hypothetical protein
LPCCSNCCYATVWSCVFINLFPGLITLSNPCLSNANDVCCPCMTWSSDTSLPGCASGYNYKVIHAISVYSVMACV